MKKSFILLFLLFYITSNVFTDENGIVFEEKQTMNSIDLGLNFTGYFFSPLPIFPSISFDYERLLGKYFSIGLEIGTLWHEALYFEIRGRIYPFSGLFMGLSWGICFVGPGRFNNQIISTELGWKINMKNNKWHFMPSVGARLYDPVIYDKDTVNASRFGAQMISMTLNLKIGYKF